MFGATHLGSMLFLARAAPGGLGVTVQGYFTLAMGLVMAGAMSLSGVMYEAFGIRTYAAGGATIIRWRAGADGAPVAGVWVTNRAFCSS